MKNPASPECRRTTLLLLALGLMSAPPLPAIDVPGADLWTGLLLGEVDTNNDGNLDSGEMSDGLAKGFSALDSDFSGSIAMDEVDAVKEEISGTLGDTGAALAVTVIKKLLQVTAATPLDKDTFEKRGQSLFADLDTDQSALITPDELEALPVAVIKLLR
jgi:hypothetical protein